MRDLQETGVLQRADKFWGIIQDSLCANFIKQFVGALEVMDASPNLTTKDLARQLSECAGIPIPGKLLN